MDLPPMDYQQWVDAYAEAQRQLQQQQQPATLQNQCGQTLPNSSLEPQVPHRPAISRSISDPINVYQSNCAHSHSHSQHQAPNQLLHLYPSLVAPDARGSPFIPSHHIHSQHGFDSNAASTADPHQTPNQLSHLYPSFIAPAANGSPLVLSHDTNSFHPFASGQAGPSPPQRKRPRRRANCDGNSSADDASYPSQTGAVTSAPGAGLPKAPNASAIGSGRLPGACTHCKKLKMKCEFPKDANICRRCKSSGHRCIVEGRKPRSAPNRRKYLLAQLRQKDAVIESLLRQLHNPYLAPPLSIATYRMSVPGTGTSSDTQHENVMKWLNRMQSSSVRPPASGHPLRPASQEGWSSDGESADYESDGSVAVGGGGFEDEESLSLEKLIPDAAAPLGLFADLSLTANGAGVEEKGSGAALGLGAVRAGKAKSDPGAATTGLGEDGDDADVGVANEGYFMPGPATDLKLRAKLIEKHSLPEILLHGLVTLDDVDRLFEIFFKRINIWQPLLDPEIHTPATVFARCPFLFTCICAVSSRYSPEKSDIYSIAMHFAKSEASNALIHGWKTVELCQAYLLLSLYGVPAKRWEEDRSWLYAGLAIRIAIDLNLQIQTSSKMTFQNERQEREHLNRTRTWMLCFNQDRSTATQFGKPWTIKEDYIIRRAADFYKSSQFNSPYDIHMCGYNQLLLLLGRVHSEIYSDPESPTGLNTGLDLREVIMKHNAALVLLNEEWKQRFARDSDPTDPVCVMRAMLLPYAVNYSRLVIWSFPFQQAFKRGITPDDQLVFTTCMESAKNLIKVMIEGLIPTGLMRYSPDEWFLFSSFASAFLLKLLRPEFALLITAQHELEIINIIGRLVDLLSSPEIVLDERHAPKLYARFLRGLLAKHTREGSARRARLPPQPPFRQRTLGGSGFGPSPGGSNDIGGDLGGGYRFSSSQGDLGQNGGLDPGNSAQYGFTVTDTDGMTAPNVALDLFLPNAETMLGADPATSGGYDVVSGDVSGSFIYESSRMSSPDSPGMTLASMQAIKNPAFWDTMMLPGFSWPEQQMGTYENISGITHGFQFAQAQQSDIRSHVCRMEVSDEELGEKHDWQDDVSLRGSILQLLSTCAKTNASQLITALQQCIEIRGEESIPDMKLERHASALRELCQDLPASQSLASVVSFSEYHAWAIALTQDLGLGRNDLITEAIHADERALARNMISVVASDKWKPDMLALQGSEADKLLNLLQQAMDGVGPFAQESSFMTPFRSQARQTMLTLSEQSHLLPSSLLLKRVQVDHAQAVIGMGRFADIYAGSHDDGLVALKRIRLLPDNREKFLRKVCREALPWRQLRHPHVLPFLGLDTDSFAPAVCMVSPLMRHGHIMKYMEECNSECVSELSIAKDIADGVRFLHSEGVVHGDLRAANILVNDQGHIQIADFGLASFLELVMTATTTETIGNPRWAAPELLNPEQDDIQRSYATDIFSLGRLYLEIFTRKPPFHECKRDAAVSLKVVNGDLPSRPTDKECPGRPIPDNVWTLMVSCWSRSASARPTAARVKDELDSCTRVDV